MAEQTTVVVAAEETAGTTDAGLLPGGQSIAAKMAQVKAERAARAAEGGESFGEALTKHAAAVLASEFTPAPKAQAKKGRPAAAAVVADPLSDDELAEYETLTALGAQRTPGQFRRLQELAGRIKVVNVTRERSTRGGTRRSSRAARSAGRTAVSAPKGGVHVKSKEERAKERHAAAVARKAARAAAAAERATAKAAAEKAKAEQRAKDEKVAAAVAKATAALDERIAKVKAQLADLEQKRSAEQAKLPRTARGSRQRSSSGKSYTTTKEQLEARPWHIRWTAYCKVVPAAYRLSIKELGAACKERGIDGVPTTEQFMEIQRALRPGSIAS